VPPALFAGLSNAGWAHARQSGKKLGRPATVAALHTAEIRKLHRAGISKIRVRPPPAGRANRGAPHFGPIYFPQK
jgi:hypothetical protein